MAAYNPPMIHALTGLNALLAPAVLERVTLLANHVLASEAVATQRLAPHAGKSIAILWRGWPSLLPPPLPMAWKITPAGLLEWRGLPEGGTLPAAELTLTIDAAQPSQLLSQMLAARMPEADIAGDAALAADIGWLMQNLRWDIAADLERFFPPMVAQGLAQLGSALAAMVRSAVSRLPRMQPSPQRGS